MTEDVDDFSNDPSFCAGQGEIILKSTMAPSTLIAGIDIPIAKSTRFSVNLKYVCGINYLEALHNHSIIMIKSVIQFLDSTDIPIIAEYSYDDDGNLVIPGFVYDNKISFLRTNKVWMFLSRDYSVNNPFPANSYNSFGLPLVFNHTSPPGYRAAPIFLWDDYYFSEFSYKKIK